MARIPKRLYGPAQIATGPATVYTVPATTKTILRYLHVQNPSGSPVTFTISIGASAAATRFYDAYSIPAAAAGVSDNVRPIWLYIPMEAGDIIQLAAGTNNILTIIIAGDEIILG